MKWQCSKDKTGLRVRKVNTCWYLDDNAYQILFIDLQGVTKVNFISAVLLLLFGVKSSILILSALKKINRCIFDVPDKGSLHESSRLPNTKNFCRQ